jgi:V/A-type H+-transporting ATPase subunit C
MAKLKRSKYLYASARIRALEKTLLNKERVERMLDAKTLEDSVKVLYECKYGTGEELPATRYEELLSSEHRKVVDLVRSLDKRLISLFLLQYDYLNAKILLKAEFLGDDDYMLSSLGEIPVSRLRQSIHERSFVGMTRIMENAVRKAIDEFGKSGDPQCIDTILDKACYEEMTNLAKEIGSPFITGYVKREIDGANIKAFIRIKRQRGSTELLRNVYVKGGSFDISFFLAHFDDDLNAFSQALAHTEFGEFIESAAADVLEGNLNSIEKLLDNNRINKLKKAKLVAFGIEPVAAYMIAKENDIKIARIILAGKAAGLPSEKIAERVRETYV